MSKLKRAFTIIMCVLLTLPMCLVSKPNNVYAAVGASPTNNTISTYTQVYFKAGHDYSTQNDSTTTPAYDLRRYDQASFSWEISIAKPNGNASQRNATVSLAMTDKNNNKQLASFSKYLVGPSNGGSGNYTFELEGLRNSGEDLSNVVFTASVSATTSYSNSASATISDISLISYTPSFQPNSYVQSNGNLTPVKYDLFIRFFHIKRSL